MVTKLSERFVTDPAPLPLGGDELIEMTVPGSSPYTVVSTAQDIANLLPAAALPVANGGTGSTTASAARTALGLGTLATQSGTFPQTTVSGNAGSATVLATPRAINGVNFDGSAPITVTAAAGTLSGATLAAGVTASSLTSVGTLTSLVLGGAVTGVTDLTTTGNTILGNASTDTLNVGNGDFVKDASGNVGMGAAAASPYGFAKKHTLYDAVSATYTLDSGGVYKGEFGISNGGILFGTYAAHPVRFFINGAEAGRFDASGNLILTLTATPPTLAVNSQMVFNLTSNTNLRISVRGTDGTTRVANITLS